MGQESRLGMSKQPISPVTDPLQFRAIGLVRGIYRPKDANVLNSGVIHAMDNTQLEAVLLGRVIHLVRRYVDLEQPHMWVCYPRILDKGKGRLQLQVMGVWEPSLLDRADQTPQDKGQAAEGDGQPDEPELPDGYFSVRGELMFTDPEAQWLLVRIRQQPRVNTTQRARNLKLRLHGFVPRHALRHFLNLDLKRQGQDLHVEHYDVIQFMPRGRPVRGRGGRGKVPSSRGSMGRPARPGGSVRPGRPRPRPSVLKRSGPEA